MAHKIIFMLSGQGSQYHQMGRFFYDTDPTFRRDLERLDEIPRDLIGQSLLEQIFGAGKDAAQPFARTLHTHPGLFMVELATARLLIARGITPDLLVGASLGEFVAAVLAGVVPAEAMLAWLVQKAQAMEQLCRPGGMLAVLANPGLIATEPGLASGCSVAGINYDEHFVLAGDAQQIEAALRQLETRRLLGVRLPVSFGFHSPNVDPAMATWRAGEARMSRRTAEIPWISCLTGQPVTAPAAHSFADVARAPILFREALQVAAANWPDDELCLIDVGPSGTLANFAGRNLPGPRCKTFAILSPLGKEAGRLDVAIKATARQSRQPEQHRVTTQAIRNDIDRRPAGMKAYVFPGQGSQAKGMGRGLFEKYREQVATADQILGYSIEALCLEDRDRRLSNTKYTQPALFVVNALTYLDLESAGAGRPDFVAGHSLGEYNALFAAGALSFEVGLKMVQRRGELMAAAEQGAMAAVTGLTEDVVRRVLATEGLADIDIANLNAPTQIVISGPAASVSEAQAAFERNGCVAFIRLPVSGAFHSRLMAPAAHAFAEFLRELPVKAPTIPVIANVTARPYPAQEIRELLVAQITSSVRWTASVQHLRACGVGDFKEVGPGNVLTGLIRKIMRELPSERAPADHIGIPAAPVAPARPSPEAAPVAPPRPAPDAVPLAAAGAAGGLAPASNGIKNGRHAELPPAMVIAKVDEHWPVKAPPRRLHLRPEVLGCAEFRRDHNVRYAYVTGAMVHGIASTRLVQTVASAGMLGYFGTGGLSLAAIADAITYLQKTLPATAPYGMNLLHGPKEGETVDLFLKMGITKVEAAGFMSMTPALIKYRLAGLARGKGGAVIANHRILAKVSRPEVASAFLSPPPAALVEQLVAQRAITADQAEAARGLAMADDICVESDSGGHTDMGSASTLMPAMLALRDDLTKRFGYRTKIRVGAAGGIGTPEAAAAAFILGADFILTGSINQCSAEAGISDVAKDMLQDMNVQDTAYAPAGDMFEMGSKVQVLKKGVFFPARANRLYELYKHYESLDEIPEKVRVQIEQKYFGRSFASVYDDCRGYYPAADIARAEQNPKQKMAYVFRWYFGRATRLALAGEEQHKVDFQIQCGPALGAFNQWVKNTPLANWRNRHVDEMGKRIMEGTAHLLGSRIAALAQLADSSS
jgi:trans-AT polyketide synthase/acyltransferase/oxidoreductase domain-containing protein